MACDKLCILSGIAPGQGPFNVMHGGSPLEIRRIATWICLHHPSDRTVDEVAELITSPLTADDTVWPKGLADWKYRETCVAIGHFDPETGDAVTADDFSRGWDVPPWCPSGQGIETRRVRGPDSGMFQHVLLDEEEGERDVEMKTICGSSELPNTPNFFVLEGCYIYLQAWLDPDLPLSTATPPLDFAGEFYEIVNSQREWFDETTGLLPAIDYGGITQTLRQFQDTFAGAQESTMDHTASAIAHGLRDAELMPALLKDFNSWWFQSPDMWPSPAGEYAPSRQWPAANGSSTPFTGLPTEILLFILINVPLPSIVALSTTSKPLRNLIMDPDFLNHMLKQAVHRGNLRWLLPVETLPGESERANAVAEEWISINPAMERSSHNDEDLALPFSSSDVVSPFSSPDFPYTAFVCECYRSDSMRNRERLWGIVKQFDVLWRRFRVVGRERNDFKE